VDVRARLEHAPVGGHVGLRRVAQRLQPLGGDEAVARELPLADHAPRVEVVVLVPAVVLDLAALLGLDHGEQQGPELDRVVLHAGDRSHRSLLVVRGRATLACF
jgi:hypothetical protein